MAAWRTGSVQTDRMAELRAQPSHGRSPDSWKGYLPSIGTERPELQLAIGPLDEPFLFARAIDSTSYRG
jgi:hypothetical protein